MWLIALGDIVLLVIPGLVYLIGARMEREDWKQADYTGFILLFVDLLLLLVNFLFNLFIR